MQQVDTATTVPEETQSGVPQPEVQKMWTLKQAPTTVGRGAPTTVGRGAKRPAAGTAGGKAKKAAVDKGAKNQGQAPSILKFLKKS